MDDVSVMQSICEFIDATIIKFKTLIDYDKIKYCSNKCDHLFAKYQGYPILEDTYYK